MSREVELRPGHVEAPAHRRRALVEHPHATRDQFYLIEIMLERRALSNTLTRYVAGLKRGQASPTE